MFVKHRSDGSRHLIHLVFLGEPTGGSLSAADDAAIKQLVGLNWKILPAWNKASLQHDLERDYGEFQRSGVVLGKLWV
jgi:hypothetical protein